MCTTRFTVPDLSAEASILRVPFIDGSTMSLSGFLLWMATTAAVCTTASAPLKAAS